MLAFSRRSFVASILSAPLATALPSAGAARVPQSAPKSITPLSRVHVGRFEVTFLSDGFIDFPFSLFTGAPEEEVRRLSAAHFAARPTGVRRGFTVWLIRDSDRLILVDAGAAGTVSKTSGQLPSALAAVGVKPEMIDAVIVTHMHVDHTAGLIAGGRANFPNAEVYVDRRDIIHFTNPAKAAAAPDLLKSSFATAEQLTRLYPKLQQIEGERQITRGISTIDLSGHTPGQIGVRIEDGGQSLLLVSDMILHPAHPANPTLGLLFEEDKAAADAARRRFFARAADEQALLAATHMPFPGLGRIVKDGNSLHWLAAEWEYDN